MFCKRCNWNVQMKYKDQEKQKVASAGEFITYRYELNTESL